MLLVRGQKIYSGKPRLANRTVDYLTPFLQELQDLTDSSKSRNVYIGGNHYMSKPKSGKTFEYVTGRKYDGMMGRCYRLGDKSYINYGGRGIRVSAEWIRNIDTFRSFISSELVRLNITLEDFIDNSSYWQLDRIDVNGHYEASNCRLAPPQTNMRNKRNGKVRTYTAADGSIIHL